MDDNRFARLSDRQRIYLRLVLQHHTSHEIGFMTGASGRAVDKHLRSACKIIGVTSRVEAARRFAEYEARVESFDPEGATISSSRRTFWRFPLPLPSKSRPINMLTRSQILAWAMIIAIATPAGITVAAMLIIAIALLLGRHF
jgi:DNA-binding CsgD family transcriptional regulator